jgi:hyperosmotically inducible protein
MKFINISKTLLVLILISINMPVFAQQSMDDAITGMIDNRLISERLLSPKAHIDVTTHNGMVKISGEVNTDAEADSVISLAQSVSGVKGVDVSTLNVKKHKQNFSDMVITAKIKGLFFRKDLFSDYDISLTKIQIHTHEGIVYFTGTASHQNQVDNAIKLAKSIKGVKKVISNVQIKSP